MKENKVDSCFTIPLPFLVNLTQGSPILSIVPKDPKIYERDVQTSYVGNTIKRGDKIRIYSPTISLDWIISPDRETDFDDRILTLTKPYDHSRIIQIENAVKENQLSCERLSRKSNSELSPDYLQTSDGNEMFVKRSTPTSGSTFQNIRVWKLEAEKKDHRQAWRKAFDNGDIHWEYDFATSPGSFRSLGVRIKLSELEKMCVDLLCDPKKSLHKQRVNYVSKVNPTKLLDEAFNHICQWHPIGNRIDQVKWAKFSRKMKFLPNMANAKHEVDMAFFRQSSKQESKKLDFEGYVAVIKEISIMQFPHLDSLNALSSLLWNTVIMLPSVNRLVWYEAKLMAMRDEAKLVCAQIRLSTYYRRFVATRSFVSMKKSVAIVSRYIRRRIFRLRVCNLIKFFEDERVYWLRHFAAVQVQKSWRKFHWTNFFRGHMDRLVVNDKNARKSFRIELRQRRSMRESETIYKRVQRIQRTICVIKISMKEKMSIRETVTSLLIEVYVSSTKETFCFALGEDTVRSYIEAYLKRKGPLTWNELLEPTSLEVLTKKLMVRVVNSRPIVIFRRRSITETGDLVRKTCTYVNTSLVVLFIYRSVEDFVFSAYEAKSTKQLRTSISIEEIERRLREEAKEGLCIGEKNDCLIDTTLLISSRQEVLINWLIQKLSISRTHHGTELVVKFSDIEAKFRKAATLLQTMVRGAASRSIARQKSKATYEKFYSREYSTHYYVNKVSNESFWTKPRLLEPHDVEEAIDEWRIVTSENGPYYINPGTGQISWISEESAARMIQRWFRRHDYDAIVGIKVDFYMVSKAVHFVSQIEVNYKNDPENLAFITNYALATHCLTHDNILAKRLFEKAWSKTREHPLILRSLAIFKMATCVAPWAMTVRHAYEMCKKANEHDPGRKMFQSAFEHFYRWAVISQNTNPLSLLNYALVFQCIFANFEQANKLYRSALTIDKTNKAVLLNFQWFQQQRNPGGLYFD